MEPLTKYEAVHFNFFMALYLLKKLDNPMEKYDEKQMRQIIKIGMIYSILSMTYNN